jgi:hypothetical protein
MTNNTDTKVPSFYTDEHLETKLSHREVHFPGTIRQAEALLKVEAQHRMTIESEAHLAANMTGGRVSDHRDAVVSAYLSAPDREQYIERLREYQREVSSRANSIRF